LFTTKGDANPLPEPFPVPARNVEAKVIYHVPVLGFIAIFLKTPAGFLVSVVLPGAAVAILCVKSILSEIKKRKRTATK
jgi:hypothetical protein